MVYLALLLLLFSSLSWSDETVSHPTPKVDRIVVVKSTRTMTLMSDGKVLKTYRVALSREPVGAKERAGDHKVPEGEYVVDSKVPHSRFHLGLHISYPNAADRERARKLGVRPGGNIEIHGLDSKYAWVGNLQRYVDWTDGCIAVTNLEIEEIYKLVAVSTPVEILPAPKIDNHPATVDPKDGSLHLEIPVVASVRPKQPGSNFGGAGCPILRRFCEGWEGVDLFRYAPL